MQERIRVYRVTLDTNIFVRAIISPSGINAYLIYLWKRDRFILVLSKEAFAIKKRAYQTRQDINHEGGVSNAKSKNSQRNMA